MLPYHAYFNDVKFTMGEKRQQKIFDSTGALALQRFTSAFSSMITPEGQTWQTLTTDNKKLNSSPRVRAYFDEITRMLFEARRKGGFSHQIQECYTSLGAFGTTGILVEPSRKGGIYYKSVPMYDFWISEDSEGSVDTVYRRFKWTANQAIEAFGKNFHEDVLK